jgi:hypothetical protein
MRTGHVQWIKSWRFVFELDDWLLKTEAGSISAFYGLRSVTETLVWLHYCLDG